MLSFSSGSKIAAISNQFATQSYQKLTIIEGLSTSSHTQMPTTMTSYEFGRNTNIKATFSIFSDPSDDNIFIINSYDYTNNRNTIYKFDLTNNKVNSADFTLLTGSNYIVFNIALNTQASSYSDFFYVGKAVSLNDGTTSFTKT